MVEVMGCPVSAFLKRFRISTHALGIIDQRLHTMDQPCICEEKCHAVAHQDCSVTPQSVVWHA